MTSNVKALKTLGFLKVLRRGLVSREDICRDTGWNRATVGVYLKLWVDEGEAHRSGWRTDPEGKTSVELFSLGPGEPAPKPSPIPRKSRTPGAAAQALYKKVSKRYSVGAGLQEIWVQGGKR